MDIELTPEDQGRLDKILNWFTTSAEPEHRQHEADWDRQDVLYFGHKRFVKAHATSSTQAGRDSILSDAQKEFGQELHIPYTLSTLETVMPRALSNRPKMLWLPRDQTAIDNIENVSLVCDAQQQRADYELKLQSTFRSAMKHGLGIQNTFWRLEQRESFALKKDETTGEWVRGTVMKTAWDDPDCEDIDPRDWFWDPFAYNVETLTKCIRRTWRNTAYCLQKIESQDWPKYPLTGEDLEGLSGQEKWQETWSARRRAAGLGSSPPEKDIHEVWEFYDATTNEITTIIDRMWVVALIQNPYWHGQLPFQIYRPIEVEHRMVGVGIIDPIEDLQRELNMLRTNRMWNAMMVIHQAYAYNDGVLDPSTIKIGPGKLVPVNGDPKDLLVPLTVGDIPNSGYQEEAALRGDIELATGVSDTVSGGSSAGETATGVQLVQASAGLRIQAYTHRGELELIRPQARQWLAINQQRWETERDIAVPTVPTPGGPQQFWKMRKITPAMMQGEYDVMPEGGATAPENVPQKRNDAMLMFQIATAMPPGVLDMEKVLKFILDKLDVPVPESFIQQPGAIPPQTLDNLQMLLTEQAGMAPEGAHAMIAMALQAAMQQQEEGAQAEAKGPGGTAQGQQLPPPTQNGAPAPSPTGG